MSQQEEQVIQEVENQEAPAVETQPVKEEISYKEVKDDGTIKLDLSKLNKFQNQNQDAKQEETQREKESIEEQSVNEKEEEVLEQPVLEEVKETPVEVKETKTEQFVEEKQEVTKAPEVNVPENLQDLVKFMQDTGGSLEDYTRLNADYSTIDDNTLLKEYYKNTKPHLNNEEVDFLLEDNYSFDEEIDEPRDIKKKKLAFKEEIVKARKHLTSLKDQYYKEVKLGSKLTGEQQEAIEFYNKYNKEQTVASEVQQKQFNHFKQTTDSLFSNDFKGFDFNVGEKTYRYNVNDIANVKQSQSDILNFVGEFLDDSGMMKNAKGYHKALYAGKNIDKIVKHFYEQGKADAIKQTAIDSKNIDMGARTIKPVVDAGGMKIKVLGGDDSSKLKFKIRK
tara:strand:+ start:2941 stop:4119 length:1179 start_codon:yes stop_codon:yes gene_type:complete